MIAEKSPNEPHDGAKVATFRPNLLEGWDWEAKAHLRKDESPTMPVCISGHATHLCPYFDQTPQ
jgi:hypothetical protein